MAADLTELKGMDATELKQDRREKYLLIGNRGLAN